MDLSALTDLAPRRQPQTKSGFGSPKNETHGSANPTHTEEYPCYEENGRLYHGFRRGIYMYPCDELERDRLDIFHKVFLVARGNALHDVPISSKPSPIMSNAAGGPAIGTDHGPRILDLGCGTGMWAVEMASRYPHAPIGPIAHNRSTTHMLKEAGFVDIKHLMFGLPLNTWPDDKYEKEVGKWHNFAFTDSTYALILGPLSRVKVLQPLKRRGRLEAAETAVFRS
ncbi:conserved hypothetical protein [Histoplasma mississippiense (nom. inval.)]|uniref:conserved hypothetical protein n=1 Tax=Ajellomyces capsulatus (strain NAm1 / WU24) TaxID=2059318 RepID=UPI000157BC41|nr:conserved hypothetical protein [Histoplasma mississippiense (nom. inval.)]EDN05765.1 conserved hypothetical protein [Histoplasma mississippiense (nom. inval.)]